MTTKILETPEVDLWIEGYCVSKAPAQESIHQMGNGQKQVFIKVLLESIRAATSSDETAGAEKQGLVAIFGREILDQRLITLTTTSGGGFIFSLTADGKQFRAWFAPFGRVSRVHFDSCGYGCIFSTKCECPDTLRGWLNPFVANKIEWTSPLGSVWMGEKW